MAGVTVEQKDTDAIEGQAYIKCPLVREAQVDSVMKASTGAKLFLEQHPEIENIVNFAYNRVLDQGFEIESIIIGTEVDPEEDTSYLTVEFCLAKRAKGLQDLLDSIYAELDFDQADDAQIVLMAA